MQASADQKTKPTTWLPCRDDFAHIFRGILMGGADVIPGVSGGTVALILGIYGRLVQALSRVDRQSLAYARSMRWRAAAEYVDLRFLVALGLGILAGIVALGGLMHELLAHEVSRGVTLSVFFGMITASARLVLLRVRPSSSTEVFQTSLLVLVAGAAAFAITGLPTSQAELTWYYLFACGIIGICAMILPGLSGAYLLLILGAYTPLTAILKRLPRGDISSHDLLFVAVFASGCLVGLLTFSKVLRWLLQDHESMTMAVLCGFMVGALRKIWPFQQMVLEHAAQDRHPQWQNIMPQSVDGYVLLCVAAAIAAGAFVLLVDRIVRVRAGRFSRT